MLLLLSACVDYKLHGDDSGAFETEETSPPVEETGDDTGEAVPAEACNGEDDDGDGAVDEDFNDADGDGIADCLDTGCAVDELAAGEVALSEACTSSAPPVADPWDTTADNVWTALSTDAGVQSIASTPLVMQLTDDDGDGDVDADDDVDVAFVGFDDGSAASQGYIVVLDAATWTEEAAIPGANADGELAVGDIDGDGFPELVAYDGMNQLHAYELDGTELWSTAPLTSYIGGMPSVAIVDLDGDGAAEVLGQETILDGATGAVLATLPGPRPFSYTQHVAADLDLDGSAEILYDGDVHAADGTLLWSGLAASMFGMVNAMVLEVDGDPEGEVVQVSDNRATVYDTDGTALTTWTFASGTASIPCAGDFDGDGEPEIAVPAQTVLHVFDLDGTEVSAFPIHDSSTMAGCAGADLDGDGALEILYADETAFYVIDGRTGAAVVTWTEHASGTLIETPSVADLDGDGTGEVLIGSNDNAGRDVWIGLTVIEHAGSGWRPGPSDWPANARVDGRFDASGRVIDVGTWWTRENTFRAVGSDDEPIHRDARISIADVCLASCDPAGAASVAVQVENPGRSRLPADTPVVLWRVDGDTRTELARQTLGTALASGETLATIVFEITRADFGSDGLAATVGDGEADCHPEDDEATWDDAFACP